MKILIPYDISTTGMNNPYLFLLMRELVQQENISEVYHGYGWLNEPVEPDVIHLHWPELLVKSKLADMSRVDLLADSHFNDVMNSLQTHKAGGAKLIITIHNEKPHNDKSGRFGRFYRQIYELADGYIHMGEASEKLLAEQYSNEISKKPSFIIPHGDYHYFADTIEREVCRKTLNIKPDEKLLLTFGAIRSAEELELGIDSFKKAAVENGIYLMAGKLPYPYKSQPEHFVARKKLYANLFNKKIRTAEEQIAPEQVQIYLNAADLLFIPRFNTLNSGNVALGFTFGKVVIGPAYGVIGEILKKTGNPVFDPYDSDSIVKAIHEGLRLAESGHGEKNRYYAGREMSWKKIAGFTSQAYHQLLNRPVNSGPKPFK